MATVTLQRLRPFAETNVQRIVGPVTGNGYAVDALGRVNVDTLDAPTLAAAMGWVYPAGAGGGTKATAGVATVDFGAFPGSNYATATVIAADIADPNAVLETFVASLLTVDHSVDEHVVDGPVTSAVPDGSGNIVISAYPNNNVPKIDRMMPWGQWSVGWAFFQ